MSDTSPGIHGHAGVVSQSPALAACISYIDWPPCRPNLRQALVRDSHKVDVESIGIALLRNLDSNWCRDAGGGGAEMGVQPGSLDVFEMIDRQACSIGFWKVKPAFFLEYPQYRDSF